MTEERPQAGGSYTRQSDGSLKRAEQIDQPAAPAAAAARPPRRQTGDK